MNKVLNIINDDEIFNKLIYFKIYDIDFYYTSFNDLSILKNFLINNINDITELNFGDAVILLENGFLHSTIKEAVFINNITKLYYIYDEPYLYDEWLNIIRKLKLKKLITLENVNNK